MNIDYALSLHYAAVEQAEADELLADLFKAEQAFGKAVLAYRTDKSEAAANEVERTRKIWKAAKEAAGDPGWLEPIDTLLMASSHQNYTKGA